MVKSLTRAQGQRETKRARRGQRSHRENLLGHAENCELSPKKITSHWTQGSDMIRCAVLKIISLYGNSLVRRKGGKRENGQKSFKYASQHLDSR